MQKGLVSIITPCYNTGDIVHRLLDSVLLQDYPNVEMFTIDDGSSDNTEEVIKSYIPKFKEKGYTLTYVKQENGGQSSALNNGLKLVKGEFLIWPDSDDYFSKSYALSKFVEELQKRDYTYGVVRCVPTYIDEDTLSEIGKYIIDSEYYNEHQFENCLYATHFFWGAGNYMIKTEALDKVNPSREIYVEKNAGQNWQMFLPILYFYKCITIEESLFNILARSSSHSRGTYKSYEQQLLKYNSYQNTILETLNSMSLIPTIEKEKYSRDIRIKYKLNEIELAVLHKRTSEIKRIKRELSHEGYFVSKKWEFKLRFSHSILGKAAIKILHFFRG